MKQDLQSSKTLKGTCLCKAVTVSFLVEKKIFDACHCGMCRRWGGGPALTVDGGAKENIKFTGEESITTYSSSDWAERGFCRHCGTHLFYRLKESDFCHFPLGLFDATEDFKFHLQIFIDKKPNNYSFSNHTELMTEAEVFAKYSN